MTFSRTCFFVSLFCFATACLLAALPCAAISLYSAASMLVVTAPDSDDDE